MFLIFFISLALGGCTRSRTSYCSIWKAFTSFKDLHETLEPNQSYGDYNTISFESIRNLVQIDSIRKEFCRNDKIDCFAYLTTKYNYNKDTLYLPLFTLTCGDCAPSIGRHKKIFLRYISDSCLLFDTRFTFFQHSDTITMQGFKNRLDSIIQINLTTYYNDNESLFKTINDSCSLKEYYTIQNRNQLDLDLTIDSKADIQLLKNLINLSLDEYYKLLQDFISQTLNKDICKLTDNELRLLSRELFFRISVNRYCLPENMDF